MEVERDIERQEREIKEMGVGSEAKTRIKELERELDHMAKELEFMRKDTDEKDEEIKQLLE